jgi:hypothetical protein
MDRVTCFPGGPRSARSVLLVAGLSLLMCLFASAYARASLVQQEKLTAAEGAKARFGFGVAVSADGNTALVGARNGNSAGEGVWVFVREGTSWTRQAALNVAPEGGFEPCRGEGECDFAGSVALSADGDTALVGDPLAAGRRGLVFVFTRSGSTWTRQPVALGPAEEAGSGYFGRSVALSSDGTVAVVGGPGDRPGGSAWVFTRSSENWTERLKLADPAHHGGDHFGRSVGIAQDGTRVLIGSPGDQHGLGAAWVFSPFSSGTHEAVKLTGGGEGGKARFGAQVAVSADGATALIAGSADEEGEGAAWVFARTGSSWAQQGAKLTLPGVEAGSKAGFGVALSGDGKTALLGAPRDNLYRGSAWIFRRAGASWTQGEELIAGGERGRAWFGASAALSENGRTALVSGYRDHARDGAAWVFEDNSELIEEPTTEPPVESTTGKGPAGTAGIVTQPALGGVLSSKTTTLPPPTLAVNCNLVPLSGRVLVKLPGSKKFILLTGAIQVPMGTIVDARHGKLTLTTARPHGGTQTVTFYEGMFRITQKHSGQAVATLVGGNFKLCPTAAERRHLARTSATRRSRRRTVRKLWAEGHGSYSTKGNYATGAVLGTRWLTEDRCEGTLIRVLTDKVSVRDLVKHRRHTVRAGHSYLAKAPG